MKHDIQPEGTRELTLDELNGVSGGLDIGGAINAAVGAVVGAINQGLGALFPKVTGIDIGPVTVTVHPK